MYCDTLHYMIQTMYEPLLAVQLQHSEVGGAETPHIVPVKGNRALASYAAISDNLQMSNSSDKFAGQYVKCVWGLMMALWGDLTNENNVSGSHSYFLCYKFEGKNLSKSIINVGETCTIQ